MDTNEEADYFDKADECRACQCYYCSRIGTKDCKIKGKDKRCDYCKCLQPTCICLSKEEFDKELKIWLKKGK